MRLAWMALAGAALAGCSHTPTGYVPQPPPPIKTIDMASLREESLMPLAEGATWNYEIDILVTTKVGSNAYTADAAYRVRDVRTEGSEKRATLEFSILNSQEPPEVQRWSVGPKGIYQESAGANNEAFSTPQPLLEFPLREHKTFEWKGTGPCPDGKPGRMTVKGRVLDPEIVDTARGVRVSALPVEIHTDFVSSAGKGSTVNTTWFQPDAGIVRYVQDFTAADRKSHLLMTRKQAMSSR